MTQDTNTSKDWKWEEGKWRKLVKSGTFENLGNVPLTSIGVPWSWNIVLHPNYDRLFWDIWENGLKTPLLVKSWDWPPIGSREKWGCKEDGNRLDAAPFPIYEKEPEYELIIGNMRYTACYITGIHMVPCLMIPESDWFKDVQELWKKYHPCMEGTWYDNPDYKFEKEQSGTAIIKSGK